VVKTFDIFSSFIKGWVFIVVFGVGALGVSTVAAAPSPDLWPRWQVNQPDSMKVVDHSIWARTLAKYLVTTHPSKINRVRYSAVAPEDRKDLARYIKKLQREKVSSLSRQEQKAYWVNLYNSLTVKIILDYYPVKSIMDIDISPGFFSNGPWDAKLLEIEGHMLSLNDIEHRILRPIFKDDRLHYALNCASLGCPDLQPVAFTAANIEKLLEDGARTYINSSRGAQIVKGKLTVSSIFKWFQVDFGGSELGVIRYLQKYAEGDLVYSLSKHGERLRYDYDWNLNEN